MHFSRRKDLLQLEEGVQVGGVQLCTRGPNSAGGGAQGRSCWKWSGSRMGMKSYSITYSIQTLKNIP